MTMSNVLLPPYGPSPVGINVGVRCTPRTSRPTNAASMPDTWTWPPMDTIETTLMLFAKAFAFTVQSGAPASDGDALGGGAGGGEGNGDGGEGGLHGPTPYWPHVTRQMSSTVTLGT